MESKHIQNETKSLSLFNLDKKENVIKKKLKKPKQQSSKCSLSRKKTSNIIIKDIFNDKNIKKDSKIFNVTPNSKNIKISTNLKQNNSLKKIKKNKSKDANSLMAEQKRIFTINIRLDSNDKNDLNKNKIHKNFKSNKLNHSKKVTRTNINESRRHNDKIKKIINLSITPKKKLKKNINSGSKNKKKNLLFLNITHNNNNNKIEEYNKSKNKFSKSVVENSNEFLNYSNNNINININNINFNNNINNDINNNVKNINRNNTEKDNKNEYKKILVIDLDETLIHTSFQKIQNPDLVIQLDSYVNKNHLENNKNINNEIPNQKTIEAYIRIRPGVDKFLCQISNYYDIYVYSASSKNYLNTIIKNLDKNNIIKQCYCRDDCIMYVEDYEEDFDKPNNKYKYIKDLKKINKELRNIVFIDNNTISFKLQEKNGIPIKSWFGDYEDLELYKLIPILKNLSGFYDVRVEISKFVQNKTFIWSKSINWLVENCLNSSYLNEINSVLLKEQQKHEFQIDSFNNINMNINKPKVVNNINNILINLNEDNNNFTKNKFISKRKSFFRKVNTEFNKNLKSCNYKNIKVYKNNSDINNSEKILMIGNNLKRNNKKIKDNIKRYSNSNYSQKIQKNLFKKKIINPNYLIKNPLVHQYSICFTKNNLIDKVDVTQNKPSMKKKKINDSKIINKYFLQEQNKVIINYINNNKK